MTKLLKPTLLAIFFTFLRLNSSIGYEGEYHLRGHHREPSLEQNNGKGSKEPRNLIVGGTEVQEGDYPYLVYLEIYWGNSTYTELQYCGGTLIHPDWILTSAYCVYDAKEIVAILGAHDITKACEQGEPVECHSIDIDEDVHMVPEYNISWAMGDFALIKLPKSSNKTTAYLNWIYWLPKVNDTVWVAGRGATSPDKYFSNVPMETEAVVMSHEDCELEYRFDITPDLQCARGRGLYDVCYGDSGGPIVVKPTDDSLRTLSNGRDVLVGVVNWAGTSLGCRLMTRPTYYNRVASAFSWIVSVAPEMLDTTFGLII